MADTKITALAAIATVDPAADVLPIVDISDTSMAASGTTKKVTTNQILGAGGTATLASAAITGAATVGTTLGVTGASTLASASVTGALGAAGLNVTGATIPANGVYLGSANNLSFSYASTLGMTLNSTGLGIGASPTQKLSVNGAIDFKAYVAHMDNFAVYAHTTDGTILSSFTGYPICFRVANSEKARIDTSGHLGLGVTPSTWSGTFKMFETLGGSFGTNSNGALYIPQNATFNAGWLYKNTLPASYYAQSGGVHQFFNAPSGTAGNAITFTQAMTLDASGNLLVGTVTAPAGTKVGTIAKLNSVSLEGTGAISVSTTPVALAKALGTGGLFFVTGYNTTGGNQGWWLVASTGGGTPTVIANSNLTGLTVAFTTVAGIVYMNTVTGTIEVNSFAITN